jgi:hypothetical protein
MEKFITRYLPFATLMLVLIGLPTALILVRQSQDIRQRAASSIPVNPTPSNQTTLGFNSSFDPAKIKINQTFVVELVLETPHPVTAVKGTIQFDPSKLEVISVNRDGSFNQPLFIFSQMSEIPEKTINQNTGVVNYTILNTPDYQSTGYGSVGEIFFKAKKAGITAIAYDFGQTAVSAKGFGSSNMLNRVMPLTFTITDDTTNMPTITPTNSPTPTPTLTPIIGTPATGILYDLNKDGTVDILDYALFIPEFGKTTPSLADFDKNGKVDIFDYNLFVQGFGMSVPTPATPTPTMTTGYCGDGICQSITCMEVGCPAPEDPQTCPQDCTTARL